MTATDTAPRTGGRPAADPEQLEAQGLIRIAQLAAAILRTLRNDDRRSYPSEKALRAYLTSDGVPFASGDVGPALALLEAAQLVSRPRTSLGVARPGWLAEAVEKPVELDPQVRLGRLILTVCGNRDTAEELAEKLDACDEDVPPQVLRDWLRRLWDAGCLKVIQLSPSYPPRYVPSNRGRPFDETDLLASDIVAVLRSRDELGYEDEQQLRQWVSDAGIEYEDGQFELAMGQLWRAGRLETPRLWERKGEAKPTWIKEPVRSTGYEASTLAGRSQAVHGSLR